MASVNKAIIVGNLGADPDVRTFDNGDKIATISVATSERWTDKQTGEQREHTEWHRIIFQNRLAEIAEQYLRKGSQVYVEGSLRTRKWTDNNSIERYTTEIRANTMQMLGNRTDGTQGQNGGYPQAQGYQAPQQDYQQPQVQAYAQNPTQGYQAPPQAPQHTPNPPQGMTSSLYQPMGQAQPSTLYSDNDMPF